MESGKRKLLNNPRKKASLISVLFFGWTIPIFKKSYTKLLHINDAFEPLNEDRSKALGDRLEKCWEAELDCKKKPSLVRAAFKAFWIEIVGLASLGVLTDAIMNLSVPIALGSFLTYFQEKSDISKDDAFKYGISIFIFTMGGGMGFLHYFYHGAYYAMRVRVALSSLIYRKVLRLSQKALSQTATGKLVNLLSNDVNRFDSLVTLHPLWISPLTTIGATYILWREIQWAGIIGVAIILVFTPVQSYAGKLSAVFRFRTALRTDERARFMDEIISGVQVIKMYAWERPFQRLIAITRKLELNTILKNSYVRSFYMTIALFTTRFALFCSLLSFVLLYGSDNITVPKMFMTSYLFNFISVLMGRMFIRGISDMGEALMALKRLQMFLEYEERNESFENNSEQLTTEEMQSRNLSIFMKNVSAEWAGVNGNDSIKTAKKVKNNKNTSDNISNDSEKNEMKSFRLQEISLEVPKGQLIFVVGSVGSGKSTLLQTLLRELPLVGGSMTVNGSISYASQESWIFTSNIRQNITFSESMDLSRYDQVVKCTALTRDFTQFSGGDMTLVGEHGAGLSGGQKARINLARAVYRKASVYLIDDPLSAVDAHVQSHLFQKCLGPNGFLAQENSTRILVTHQLQFLREADWIVVLKEGKIETQGDYNTIIRSSVDLTKILENNEKNEENNSTEIEEMTKDEMNMNSRGNSLNPSIAENGKIGLEDSENSSKDSSKEEIGLLKELEGSSKGKVKGSLLFHYFKSANRTWTLVFIIVAFLLAQIFASVADVWVSFWIKKEENRHQYLHTKVYNKIYKYENSSNNEIDSITPSSEIDLWPTETFVYIYSGIMLFLLIITAARSAIYSKFCAIASQNLHDTMFHGLIHTPMKFFDDNPVGRIMNRFTKDLGSVDEALSKVILDAFQNNLNVVGAIIITICTDPKLSIVIALMGGLFIFIRKIYLRSSKNTKRLEGMTKSPVFTHISATLSGLSTIRASQAQSILRDEFEEHQDLNTSVCFMFIGVSNGFGMSLDLMAYIYVASVLYFFLAMNEGATGDVIGLAITQSLALAGTLQYGVRYSADVENHLMSFERILEYCQLKPEKQPEIPQNASEDWPSKGKVEFKNVSYRYSADSEPVLRGLTFSVEPKEKISVVGRTGAGKSSLISSIFRLAHVDGDILLDNVKTSCIELSVLRSRVSIIPQEPILFSGTLRRNLDPFEEYGDDDIWNALENVELKELVGKTNFGLAMPVLARGQNFSTGQRQILCLARAILRRNKIIILDEATANVDLQTDAMIQRTIREKFADCTVITVAHRLHTVIDSDRVLVMDAGAAVEFDAPYILMQKTDGIFRNLTEALGPQEYERLYSKAKETFETARAKD